LTVSQVEKSLQSAEKTLLLFLKALNLRRYQRFPLIEQMIIFWTIIQYFVKLPHWKRLEAFFQSKGFVCLFLLAKICGEERVIGRNQFVCWHFGRDSPTFSQWVEAVDESQC
jgi:hypothetical protein